MTEEKKEKDTDERTSEDTVSDLEALSAKLEGKDAAEPEESVDPKPDPETKPEEKDDPASAEEGKEKEEKPEEGKETEGDDPDKGKEGDKQDPALNYTMAELRNKEKESRKRAEAAEKREADLSKRIESLEQKINEQPKPDAPELKQ